MQTIDCGGIVLDYESLSVVVGSRRVLLTLREFDLAAALLLAEGDAVDSRFLAEACLRSAARDHRAVVGRVVARLRRLLFPDGGLGRIVPAGNGWSLRRTLDARLDRQPARRA